MAVFVEGKALVGTERRSATLVKKNRVRMARALWKANRPVGKASTIYARRSSRRRELI